MFSDFEKPTFQIDRSSELSPPPKVRFVIKDEPVVPLKASELLANAISMRINGEPVLAMNLFRQALGFDSFNAVALKNLWELIPVDPQHLYEREMIAVARYQSGPTAETTLALAKIRNDQERYQEAQELYFQAAAFESEDPLVQFEIQKDLGNLFVRNSDYESAEEYYFKAHSLLAESDTLQVNMGTLEIQRSNWILARERFGQALRLNPKSDKAWVGVAISHFNMGELDLAAASLQNAIEINPVNRTAVHLMAAWALKSAQYEPAIQALQFFLSEAGHDREMSLALIHLFCESKQASMALLEIERSLLWDPEQSELLELEQTLKG